MYMCENIFLHFGGLLIFLVGADFDPILDKQESGWGFGGWYRIFMKLYKEWSDATKTLLQKYMIYYRLV